MSENVELQIEIPVEAIEALKRYTLDSLMLDGDVPHDIKRAITKSLGDHIEKSPVWESIAEAIADDIASRQGEIVKSISDRMVSQIAQGVNHAASQVVHQLGTKLKSARF